MNIIPLNFSYKKLYEIGVDFAERHEYDYPIYSAEVVRDTITIKMHFYNSPLFTEFSCDYVIIAGINDFNYDSFSKYLEKCFNERGHYFECYNNEEE